MKKFLEYFLVNPTYIRSIVFMSLVLFPSSMFNKYLFSPEFISWAQAFYSVVFLIYGSLTVYVIDEILTPMIEVGKFKKNSMVIFSYFMKNVLAFIFGFFAKFVLMWATNSPYKQSIADTLGYFIGTAIYGIVFVICLALLFGIPYILIKIFDENEVNKALKDEE